MAKPDPPVRISANRVDSRNLIGITAPLKVALTAGANSESIDAHAACRPAQAREERQLVAPAGGNAARTVLLESGLNGLTVSEAPPEHAAIQVRVFISREDIGTRRRARSLDPPRTQVHAQLVRASLDEHFLECPQLNFGEVEQQSSP